MLNNKYASNLMGRVGYDRVMRPFSGKICAKKLGQEIEDLEAIQLLQRTVLIVRRNKTKTFDNLDPILDLEMDRDIYEGLLVLLRHKIDDCCRISNLLETPEFCGGLAPLITFLSQKLDTDISENVQIKEVRKCLSLGMDSGKVNEFCLFPNPCQGSCKKMRKGCRCSGPCGDSCSCYTNGYECDPHICKCCPQIHPLLNKILAVKPSRANPYSTSPSRSKIVLPLSRTKLCNNNKVLTGHKPRLTIGMS